MAAKKKREWPKLAGSAGAYLVTAVLNYFKWPQGLVVFAGLVGLALLAWFVGDMVWKYLQRQKPPLKPRDKVLITAGVVVISFVVSGAGMYFLISLQPSDGPKPIIYSAGPQINKNNVYDCTGDRQVVRSDSSLDFQNNVLNPECSDIPKPSGELSELSNEDLMNGARSLANEISAYAKTADPKNREEHQRYYTEHFARRVTAFTAEIHVRVLGGVTAPRPDHHEIGLGRIVAIHGKLAGIDPLLGTANFLRYASFHLPAIKRYTE